MRRFEPTLMPRVCTICAHAERAAIDQALAGEPSNRRIAAQFIVTEQALRRHKADHLPATLIKSEQAKEVTRADDLIGQLKAIAVRTERLYTIADGIIGKAVTGSDWRTALMAVREASNVNREARANLEVLGELLGELNRNPTVNILIAPQWISTRTLLMQALVPFPEARAAVARTLIEVERGS